MKRIYLCLIACLTVFAVLLSGCSGGQHDNEMQSSESNSESIQSTASSSEINNSSIMSNSSSAPPSSSAQAGSEQTNTHSTPPEFDTSETSSTSTVSVETEKNMQNIEITVNGKTFSATLNDNEAAREFAGMLPLTLEMSDYSGFEKVGSLGTSLPTDNSQTTTQSGDIVLYNGNQIVIFYGSNSWSYTRLGKVDDLSGWKDALGSGDVTVTFSLKQ